MKWSKNLWKSIHELAHEADQNSSSNTNPLQPYDEYIRGVQKVLPCELCRKHMEEYLRNNPVKRPFYKWSVKFHNSINKRNKKPILSIKEARKLLYRDDEITEKQRYRKMIMLAGAITACIIILLFVIIFLFKK